MKRRSLVVASLVVVVAACGSEEIFLVQDLAEAPRADLAIAPPPPDLTTATPCGTAPQCAAAAEERTATRYEALLQQPAPLAQFLRDVPKGGDLHNHLTGASWAETLLDWGRVDG